MKNLMIVIPLLLVLNGCTKYLKTPCVYPKIEPVPKPKEEQIEGYNECKVKEGDRWVKIGKCIDFSNTLKLKSQNMKLYRVIDGYELKVGRYNKNYADLNQTGE